MRVPGNLFTLRVLVPSDSAKNGKELCSEIHSRNPDIKLLFLSGHSGDKMYRKDIHEEGIEIIPKPVNPRELLRKIRMTLDMR